MDWEKDLDTLTIQDVLRDYHLGWDIGESYPDELEDLPLDEINLTDFYPEEDELDVDW